MSHLIVHTAVVAVGTVGGDVVLQILMLLEQFFAPNLVDQFGSFRPSPSVHDWVD